jgi:hypothetical protein
MKVALPESEIEFAKALQVAAKVASVQTLVSAGIITPYISLRESYRLYGEGTVNRWIKEGVLTKIRDGEGNVKTRISRVQLEAVAQTQNRAEWYVRKSKEGKL